MRFVSMREAKTHLSRLVRDVEAGGEIIIQRDGKPVVRLVAVAPAKAPRTPGMWADHPPFPDGFFDPLSDGEAAAFYGK